MADALYSRAQPLSIPVSLRISADIHVRPAESGSHGPYFDIMLNKYESKDWRGSRADDRRKVVAKIQQKE
jgi:hypothetical protein